MNMHNCIVDTLVEVSIISENYFDVLFHFYINSLNSKYFDAHVITLFPTDLLPTFIFRKTLVNNIFQDTKSQNLLIDDRVENST